jgi:GntR family transcriptional regulator, rspAB operon transcriptional repressor
LYFSEVPEGEHPVKHVKDLPFTKDSSSLREQVYNHLRTMVLSGKIEAGKRLVETTLATEMGVSRTPVREALHKLGLENLVRPVARMGYIVNDLSEYDIEDLFATRAAIEQLAARCALEKITSDEVEKIEKNLAKTDQILRSGQRKKMIGLDTEFHEIICRASRSKRLYQIAQMLREHMLRFRQSCLHLPEIARKARDDHHEILTAIKLKDPKKLNRAMSAHMENTKRDILNYLQRLREQSL